MYDLAGYSLGRYQIIEKLGEGGMASVYKAYDTRLEREVAVKVIRHEAFSQEMLESVLKRFDREAKTLAKLIHPNIVSIIDYGDYEGSPYLVMPYLAGGTLKQFLGSPMPWQIAVKLLYPIATALAYAHGKDVIHRDVKPANILITTSGEPMLTDFGIAKMLDVQSGQTLTGTGVGIGTPEYMAPEQGIGKEVDGRSDIYSLGIVLYELVTGRKPFSADTPMAVVFKHISDPLPLPSAIVLGIPDEMERVLLKSLAKKPVDRYQSMREFAAALNALVELTLITQPAVSSTLISPPTNIERSTELVLSASDQIKAEAVRPPVVVPANAPRSWESTPQPSVIERPMPISTRKRVKIWPFLAGGAGIIAFVAVVIGIIWGFTSPGSEATPTRTTVRSKVTTTLNATTPPKTTTLTSVPPTSNVLLDVGSTQVSEKDGMVIVYVPKGEFTMGSSEGEGKTDERPQHTVYLDAYWIDQTEVTNAMFAQFVKETGYRTEAESSGSSYVYINGDLNKVSGADWAHPQGPTSELSGFEDHPVVHVTWNDAKAYCEWGGRVLPTEAQWEKAARGTDAQTFPWGNTIPNGNQVNFADVNLDAIWADRSVDDGYQLTAPVGNYPEGASPYYALDMAGNVWEWTADYYSNSYYNSQTEWVNPTGPSTGILWVIRGGSWGGVRDDLRCADRSWPDPSNSSFGVGFRCAKQAD